MSWVDALFCYAGGGFSRLRRGRHAGTSERVQHGVLLSGRETGFPVDLRANWRELFPQKRSLVVAANDSATLAKFRSILDAAHVEVLSLADLAEPQPTSDGRDARENTMLAAAIVASRTRLPAVAVARSFTIDPLFAWTPDPQLSPTRDYPTWHWQIPPRETKAQLVGAVHTADETLSSHGYCGPDDRCAYFLTTLCFVAPGGPPHFIEEWCDGQFYLHEDAVTERGLDFARCVIPAGHTEALAFLDSSSRAELSDLRRAIRSFAAWWSAQ